jgi:hypothetical protein
LKKRWIVLSTGGVVLTVAAAGWVALSTGNGPTASQGCAEATVFFDITSLEKIRRTPEVVLADVQGFWETEAPYIAAKRWEPPGYPIHYAEFERVVSELLCTSRNEVAGCATPLSKNLPLAALRPSNSFRT